MTMRSNLANSSSEAMNSQQNEASGDAFQVDRRDFLRAGAAVVATSLMDTSSSFAQTTTVPRENWSGTYHFHTNKVFQPQNEAEVSSAIDSVKAIRALGTRHSFNGIADSTSAQVSMLGLKEVTVNAAEHTVTSGGGIRLGELAEIIDKRGWALHNLPSLPHISLAGCISTATHGSGIKNGNMSTAIRGMEFVSADGRLHTLSRDKNPDVFPGAAVALGALGAITTLTVDVHPRFDVAQTVYENLSFDHLQHHLVDIMGTAYSVSLFTHWQNNRADQVWLKRRVEAGQKPPMPETFYGATLAKKKLHPAGPEMDATGCTEQGGSIGPWYERLPHFKLAFTPSSGHEIQTEYHVPLEHGYEAIRAVETLRDRITPHLIVTELRTIAADQLWMSMAYERPSLAIHFTWKPEAEAVLAVLPAIEEKLGPFHPRPHWAKVFTIPKAQIEASYPRIHDFRELVRRYDPNGHFANEYMRKNVLA